VHESRGAGGEAGKRGRRPDDAGAASRGRVVAILPRAALTRGPRHSGVVRESRGAGGEAGKRGRRPDDAGGASRAVAGYDR